jgi:hypothetical protein
MTALGGTHCTPRTFEGAARGSHRMVNVDFGALRDGGDDLFGRGIYGFEVRPETEVTRRPSISSSFSSAAEMTGNVSRE